MTALNDVLVAEQEAEQIVADAKTAAIAALQAARTTQQEAIKAEEEKLAKEAEEQTSKEEAKLSDEVNKIASDFAMEVTALGKRFSSKQTELKTVVTKHFQ